MASQVTPSMLDDEVSLHALPNALLRLVLEPLQLRERVWLCTCCKALLEHAGELLSPGGVWAVQLGSWRQARSLAAWLDRRHNRVQQLSLELPPLREGRQAPSEAFEACQELWVALGGGACTLSSLTWSALPPGDARGAAIPWPALTASPLLSLQSLALTANEVVPPASPGCAAFSALSALSSLSLTGHSIRLGPTSLPPSLRSLTIDWQKEAHMGSATPFCRHLMDIAPAVFTAPQLRGLRLLWARDQVLDFNGLERMTALTALTLQRAYMRGLPPQLTALSALQELTVQDADIDRAQFPAGTGELEPLEALTALRRLRLRSLDFLQARPTVTAGIWQLPGLEEVVMTGLRWMVRSARWPGGILSVHWPGGIPAPPPPPAATSQAHAQTFQVAGLAVAKKLARLTLDLEAALDNLPGVACMSTLEELTLLHSLHAWRTSSATVPQLTATLRSLAKLRALEVRPAQPAAGGGGAGAKQDLEGVRVAFEGLGLLAGSLPGRDSNAGGKQGGGVAIGEGW